MIYQPISVTQLNAYVKDKFQEDEFLNNVLVKGEISNFKHHYTGHMYFTLKDENSLIKCVMFKTYTSHLDIQPKDGMKVMVLGAVSVFERDRYLSNLCKVHETRRDWRFTCRIRKTKSQIRARGFISSIT